VSAAKTTPYVGDGQWHHFGPQPAPIVRASSPKPAPVYPVNQPVRAYTVSSVTPAQ
jgi:hypothetical protein